MIIFFRIIFIGIGTLIPFLYFINNSVTVSLIAAAIAFIVAFGLLILIEYVSHSVKTRTLMSALFGLILGFITAFFLIKGLDLTGMGEAYGWYPLAKALVFHFVTFLVLMIFIVNNEEIAFLEKIIPSDLANCEGTISYKILDTSVIIDGRIADICDTGFLEGILVIPNFVLNELQMIADSADSIKRNRGRRGLDILNKMQKDHSIKVKISDMDFYDIHEVDSKLVKLAKVMDAKVVTNDFNLNKVAEFHGVSVLNINQLSNALKPIVLPGEQMHVSLIKEGKDPNQAIGYLDDGTMIVVENGRRRMNEQVDVIVTSVLQTTAGRMIFARIKDDHDR
ncbi:MAG: PIN/TRAM domain-containing protein [Spirochaetota bacterium]